MLGGASITDLFASYDGQSYSPQLSAGVSGTLDEALPEKYAFPMMDRVTWMAGWNDILNLNGTNLFSRLHFGTEISLPLLQLRGGINQGYPTVGFGDLPPFFVPPTMIGIRLLLAASGGRRA
jgi:hypothetical protein